MEKKMKVEIDQSRCIGCGLCVKVCPFETIALVRGRAVAAGESCISCGHCAAACAYGAIQVPRLDECAHDYAGFSIDKWWLPYGEYDTAGLVRLMASRRSCRSYSEEPVDRSILEDLIKIGITAPSGTNSQCWTFTVLPNRRAVIAFAGYVSAFFRKLNSMSEKAVVRKFLRLIGRGELDAYYKNYYQLVKKALDEWKDNGRDRLFHGAAAVIVVASKPGASCPAEDALLATQNILLACHSMGLGTCLIGFAVSAMAEDNSIQCKIGMTSKEKVYAVIAIGHPKDSYETVAGRKKPTVRYFEG
jgi:nitroreductase/NAD-dependent dihydropyrimidine dehydrogenase PreA subunit